jgi:hypothetical protein
MPSSVSPAHSVQLEFECGQASARHAHLWRPAASSTPLLTYPSSAPVTRGRWLAVLVPWLGSHEVRLHFRIPPQSVPNLGAMAADSLRWRPVLLVFTSDAVSCGTFSL